MNRQIRILGVVLLVAFVLLFLQLNNLQVLQASKLANSPGNARNALQRFNNPRGVIQTADGVIVAQSVATNGPKETYKYLRQYPEGPLFANITGYLSYIYGSTDVEAEYNSDLTGHNLPIRDIADLFTSRTVTENVTLTLSNKLQAVAQQQLGNEVGAVVAIDPSNGSILAMYSNPTYDPNPLASHSAQTEKNAWGLYNSPAADNPMLARAFQRTYSPGSTFKVVTASAVLDYDPALATKVYPQQSSITLPNSDKTLSNFGGETCGGSLPVLLQFSCDTGFAQVGMDLSAQTLSTQAQAFGFNQSPPLDMPVVRTSFFPPANKVAPPNQAFLAYSAIGQFDVSASTLQMALVASAIANKGVLIGPHVMAQIRDNQGRLVRAWEPKPWLVATTQQTATAISQMMAGVVQGGTATNMALPGIQVAAKTGTAQTNQTLGTNNWMIAFAPVDAPKVAVAVVVPAQPGLPVDAQGATVAGPIAKAVLAAALGVGSAAPGTG